jgi:crotonobetainyl-CoA:carnitine CoA-transferase CaiB-like acyl-CoA transferase
MSQAFSGIRIIDFTQVLAGPFATQQLALLGADVIKIEERTNGDQTRGLLNDTTDSNPKMAPSFMSCNLGKRSLTLDLKSPHAKDIVYRLVENADVVVENFRAGVMDRLGFGYEALKGLKQDLIYCSVSGYGQTGPKAGTPAYDGAIQAASGMMAITGHPETGPTRTGYMPVDMGTAIIGEVGLGGEVRSVPTIDKRITEVEKLGFKRVLVPKGNIKEQRKRDLEIVEVASITEAVHATFPF